MRRRKPIMLGVVLGAASLSTAAPFTYVLNANTTIDSINIPTNNGPTVGTTPWVSHSLAVNMTGQLFSADPNGNIWNVTGGPIPVGPTGRSQIADLDYANNGLWGFSNVTKELFFFDLGSSSVTYAQVIAVPSALTFTGVAHQASTGDIYLSGYNGLNNDFLMMVPNMGIAAVPIGAMANGDAFSYFSDIDFDASGTLYAQSFYHRWYYTVNTSNGNTSFVSSGPHKDTYAMAMNPVPEPATLAILGCGALALLNRRRR